jgi:4-amino-4-deoxy-L-arabinose transferase-like glycosyltransferase
MNRISLIKNEYVVALLLFLTVSIIWTCAFSTANFERPDAYDYAQMGRELSRGNGFSTLQIFPRHIRFFHDRGFLEKDNWPNLYRYPMSSIINALLYKITGDIVKASVLSSMIGFLLSVPVLFILAVRVSNIKSALAGTLFYAANPVVFASSYSGMTEPWATFFMLLLLLIGFSKNLSKWKSLGMGILCGLGYLTRSQFAVMIPLCVLYIWFKSDKKTRMLNTVVLVGGIAISVGPWLARNYIVVGDPVFSFSNTRNLVIDALGEDTDIEIQLDAPLETSEIFEQYGSEILRKIGSNLLGLFKPYHWARAFPPDSFILLIVLVSFVYRKHCSDKRYNLFRDSVVVLVICNMLIVAMAFNRVRFYTPLQPLIYIVAASEIFIVLNKVKLKNLRVVLRNTVFFGLVLFGIFRFCGNLTLYRKAASPVSEAEMKSYESIRTRVSGATIVAADTSYKISLYADCRSLRLPAFPRDLLKINDDHLPIDYILAPQWRLNPRTSYGKFFGSSQFLKRFRRVEMMPDGSVLFERSE